MHRDFLLTGAIFIFFRQSTTEPVSWYCQGAADSIVEYSIVVGAVVTRCGRWTVMILVWSCPVSSLWEAVQYSIICAHLYTFDNQNSHSAFFFFSMCSTCCHMWILRIIINETTTHKRDRMDTSCVLAGDNRGRVKHSDQCEFVNLWWRCKNHITWILDFTGFWQLLKQHVSGVRLPWMIRDTSSIEAQSAIIIKR